MKPGASRRTKGAVSSLITKAHPLTRKTCDRALGMLKMYLRKKILVKFPNEKNTKGYAIQANSI